MALRGKVPPKHSRICYSSAGKGLPAVGSRGISQIHTAQQTSQKSFIGKNIAGRQAVFEGFLGVGWGAFQGGLGLEELCGLIIGQAQGLVGLCGPILDFLFLLLGGS